MKAIRRCRSGKIAFIASLICVFICVSTEKGKISGETRFRTYEKDSPRLERYIENAKHEETQEDWERVVAGGKEALKAQWEMDADRETERILVRDGDNLEMRENLARERREAYSKWERGMDALIAEASGRWLARRQNITGIDFDRGELRDILEEAKSSGSIEDWDLVVRGVEDAVRSRWEGVLDEKMSRARENGELLREEQRISYEREIEKIEREIRNRFDLERADLVYRARNTYISDKYLDNDSLRRISEEESAGRIAGRILQETEDALKKDVEAIVKKPAVTEGGSDDIDFSMLGENWRSELERLVEQGLNRWKTAQDSLFREMLAWKSSAEESYEAGNAKWGRAYDTLYKAKEEWRQKIVAEIDAGIEAWKMREEALAGNLARSQNDFRNYVETLNRQWDDQSLGLTNMAVSGSKVYGDAVDNVAWLTKMCERYKNIPAITAVTEEIKNAVRDADGKSISEIIGGTPPPLFSAGITESVTVNFVRSEYNKSSGEYTEFYSVTVKRSYYTQSLFGGTKKYHNDVLRSFTWTNIMSLDSDSKFKNAYYYYLTELERWKEIQAAFKKTVDDAESYMHGRNMVGWGENGPGFLVNAGGQYSPNAEGENDPYLMTAAERECVLAEKELAYWRGRLSIAEAVKEYASGVRGSAENTADAKNTAEKEMTAAKENYENGLAKIEGVVARLRSVQGSMPATDDAAEWDAYKKSIEYLTEELSKAKEAMERERETLLALQRALIAAENGEGGDFAARELREIEENLGRAEKKLRDTRFTYYVKAREAERIDRLADFSLLYRDAVYNREKAKGCFEAYRGVVNGEETDENIIMWIAGLGQKKTEIWGDMAESRYGTLSGLQSAWKNAAADERDAKRAELGVFLRNEYESLRAEYEKHNGIFALLTDRNLNIHEYCNREVVRDSAAYADMAKINYEAFLRIEDAMEVLKKEDDKNYTGLMECLRGRNAEGSYVYGENNSEYIAAHAAYAWAEENLRNVSWSDMVACVAMEKKIADKIVTLYAHFTAFNPDSLLASADAGDEGSRAVLREYYYGGLSIATLGYIRGMDGRLARREYVERQKYEYAAQHRGAFIWGETGIAEKDYSNDIINYGNL